MDNPLQVDTNELDVMSSQVMFKQGTIIEQPDGAYTAKKDITKSEWTSMLAGGLGMSVFLRYFERKKQCS